jgi:hypothetical protein
VLFLLLEHLGISRRVSIPLALVLALSPPLLVASLRQGRNPDPLTALVMVAGALFIAQRRPGPLAATMVVGALNRESALFLAPLAYAVWADRWWDPAVVRRVAAVAAPAVAVFVALRLAIPTVGREQVAGYGSLFGGRVEVLEMALERNVEQVRRLATVYGPLWLLAPFALRGFSFARRGLVLGALCAGGLPVRAGLGAHRVHRRPVVYAAAAWTLDRRPRWYWPALAGCAFLVLGYAVYMHFVGTQNIIETNAPPYPVR